MTKAQLISSSYSKYQESMFMNTRKIFPSCHHLTFFNLSSYVFILNMSVFQREDKWSEWEIFKNTSSVKINLVPSYQLDKLYLCTHMLAFHITIRLPYSSANLKMFRTLLETKHSFIFRPYLIIIVNQFATISGIWAKTNKPLLFEQICLIIFSNQQLARCGGIVV